MGEMGENAKKDEGDGENGSGGDLDAPLRMAPKLAHPSLSAPIGYRDT